VNVSILETLRTCVKALRAAAWTVLGHWKESVNVRAYRVRRRTRDLAKEAFRGHYDLHDYQVSQRAAAKSVSVCLMWLPCGVALAPLAHACNHPPLRHCDHSLDILRHKIEEYMEKGMEYKQAESTLQRYLVVSKGDRQRIAWDLLLTKVMKVLSLITYLCILLLACVLTGEAIGSFGKFLFALAAMCTAVHSFLDKVVWPKVRLQRAILIDTDLLLPEEKKITQQVHDALGSSDSSVTEDSSSDFSSANESFLDENPKSEKQPEVLGVKGGKVIVHPKACRLRLRFSLLRNTAPCTDHTSRWRHEEPLKHCRLLQVPEAHMDAFRPHRTVSFKPTEESDWNLKFKQFGLRRSRSIGTAWAEEVYERRLDQERWAGFVDICGESRLVDLPRLPETEEQMPPRGIIEDFESLGVFRRQHSEELTNAALFLTTPWKDTAGGDNLKRLGRALMGTAPPVFKTWEAPFDEALAAGHPAMEEARSARSARPRPPQLKNVDA